MLVPGLLVSLLRVGILGLLGVRLALGLSRILVLHGTPRRLGCVESPARRRIPGREEATPAYHARRAGAATLEA